MDGPISTSEAAGTPPPFTPAHARNPAPGPPEKVPPVSEDRRPRSAGREEVGKPPRRNRRAEEQEETKKEERAHSTEIDRAATDAADKARQSGSSRDTDPQREGRAKQKQSNPPETLPLDRSGNGQPKSYQESYPLPGDSSKPERYDDLADALAAAKRRWAEVNQEALEAHTLPGQTTQQETDGAERPEQVTVHHVPPLSEPSRDEAPTTSVRDIPTPRFPTSTQAGAGTEVADQDVAMRGDLHGPSVIRYQSFAMALSNPHQTRPVIDIFV